MASLMKVMIVWLSVNFGLPATDVLPEVHRLPAMQLAMMHYGSADIANRTDIMAVYDSRTKTIYLRNDWTGKTPAETSALVHELVHHLQYIASRRYRCPEEREALAYRAQQKWLALFGETLEDDFGVDDFTLKIATACLPY